MRFALRSGADAICEKPIVLNPWNIDGLGEIERDTGRKINTILQLRLHPAILDVRRRTLEPGRDTKHEVDLTYVTARGHWYLRSWKGDVKKSGGIATNIGVHFFDMLHFVFGRLQANRVHLASDTMAAGLSGVRASQGALVSLDRPGGRAGGAAQSRATDLSAASPSIGQEVEFSDGFTDLHERSYEEILAGRGFGLEENRTAIETVSSIRSATPLGLKGDYHPFLASKRLRAA